MSVFNSTTKLTDPVMAPGKLLTAAQVAGLGLTSKLCHSSGRVIDYKCTFRYTEEKELH